MKKKILFLLLFLIGFFFISDDAFAKISKENAEIECVYANGMAIGLRHSTSYDASGNKTITYKTYLNKNKSVAVLATVDLDANVTENLYTNASAYSYLSQLYCPLHLYYYARADAAGANDAGVEGIYDVNHISPSTLVKYEDNWLSWLTGIQTPTYKLLNLKLKSDANTSYASYIDLDSNDDGETDSKAIKYSLISERISFVGELAESDYAQVFEVYSEESQAVNGNKYAQFFTSTYGAGRNRYTMRWLQIGNTITHVSSSVDIKGNDKIICIMESVGTQDPNKSDGGLVFNSSNHVITNLKNDGTCPSGFVKYIKSTKVCEVNPGNPNGSFCDKYPNIAFELANIINILQLLVPALVIVFTGIDIGRIVIAGNIEEELPKKKKSIIIRIIIMIAFFFLPLIVRLIISLAEGVPISSVDCLFTNGITQTTGSGLSCYDESEEDSE